MLHSQNNQQAGEMRSVKTGGNFINQSFEDDKQDSAESVQQKHITDHVENSTGHANTSQRSNHALLALVIILCLISLVVLLFTLLMFGKIGGGYDCSANEGQCTNKEVSNGFCEHLRACEHSVFLCEHEH